MSLRKMNMRVGKKQPAAKPPPPSNQSELDKARDGAILRGFQEDRAEITIKINPKQSKTTVVPLSAPAPQPVTVDGEIDLETSELPELETAEVPPDPEPEKTFFDPMRW